MQFTQCYDHYRKVLGRVMDINTLREYLNIHLISLEQDKDKISINDEYSRCVVAGQIQAVKHILEVINER